MRGTRRTESGLIDIGDIITRVDDFPVETESDLFTALETKKPGDIVKVTVNRVIGNVSDEKNNNAGVVSLKMKEVVLETQLKASSELSTFMNLQVQ